MSVNALLYDTDSTFLVAKAEVIKLLQHFLYAVYVYRAIDFLTHCNKILQCLFEGSIVRVLANLLL